MFMLLLKYLNLNTNLNVHRYFISIIVHFLSNLYGMLYVLSVSYPEQILYPSLFNFCNVPFPGQIYDKHHFIYQTPKTIDII